MLVKRLTYANPTKTWEIAMFDKLTIAAIAARGAGPHAAASSYRGR